MTTETKESCALVIDLAEDTAINDFLKIQKKGT